MNVGIKVVLKYRFFLLLLANQKKKLQKKKENSVNQSPYELLLLLFQLEINSKKSIMQNQ